MSVFLALAGSAWIASNALAFAVRDAFPVSPGHTLVITRRVVPDRFSATGDERAAVMELVASPVSITTAARDAHRYPRYVGSR